MLRFPSSRGHALVSALAATVVYLVPSAVSAQLPIEFINVVPYHTAASKKVGNVPMTIWGPMSPYDEVYIK